MIIDENITIFDERSTIQKFMHFFEFQADFFRVTSVISHIIEI